ncbi:uncharacterized protein B0I36DRAFT_253735 [Microdochium trichocladiopsis]|uniref:Uncharacterized protein n=1 Tax=Microdochium trichocladiopsis TaxID=1682393 RepID=A0A9P9BJI1_9PEZI|nr:uncharacterized protein B0I36DRAFT_253735 [Microdochium trichocladiopsis]KAH7018120.1 hypothetical protein B0I36DRAFT_253735 [Microdochium trichocladiopsis]
MARQRKKDPLAAKLRKPKEINGIPEGFQAPPADLKPFLETLSEKHVYIAHIDNHPASFKRNIFAVPVLMNLAVCVLFFLRLWYIGEWYLKLLVSVLGYPNELTLNVYEMEWEDIFMEIGRRTFTLALDFVLTMFLWPWPIEFALKIAGGNPVMWRYNVGFRDREIIVRRSRHWDRALGDVVNDLNSRGLLMMNIGVATAPLLINEKTGYLLINAEWDLDWNAMCDATSLLDQKMVKFLSFDTIVLVFHDEYGWLSVEVDKSETVNADERLKQKNIFAFREALRGLDKEHLFYRWIELVQYESSRPGGFTEERQVEAAKQIRELFQKDNIDFDQLWLEAVGTDASEGL